MTCLVQYNVTKILVLGIKSLVASTFTLTVLRSHEAWACLLADDSLVENWFERAQEAEGCSQSSHPSRGDRHASEAIMAPPAPVNLPAGCKCVSEPNSHYTTWGREKKKSLQPRLQNPEQMNGCCWFKPLSFRCGLYTVIDDLLQLLSFQAPPCLLLSKLNFPRSWMSSLSFSDWAPFVSPRMDICSPPML